MHAQASLRALFRTLTLALIGAAAVPGCGEGSIPRAGFTENLCAASRYRTLGGVTLSVDYLELRYVGDVPPRAIESVGTACKTSGDLRACQTKLGAATSSAGWRSVGEGLESYFVFTRGDEVGVAATFEALRPLIVPVDNPKDAALLAIRKSGEFRVDCERAPHARKLAGGFEVILVSGTSCGEGERLDESRLQVTAEGAVSPLERVKIKDGDPSCIVGRRPEAFVARVDRSSPGEYFASMAELEAASVFAFDRLARELQAHGAPARLVQLARRSQEDEVLHARLTGELATRFGGRLREVTLPELPIRPLLEIAMENAVEGCVRETFGACMAMVQSELSTDAQVRSVMVLLAEDEIRHASLAWEVASWVEPLLPSWDRSRVANARLSAARELREQAEQPPNPDLAAPTGIPDRPRTLALLDALSLELWSA